MNNIKVEFECHNTKTDNPSEPPVFETFESSEWTAHDDGCGYFDVKCEEDCPYCGKEHWKSTTHWQFSANRKT